MIPRFLSTFISLPAFYTLSELFTVLQDTVLSSISSKRQVV